MNMGLRLNRDPTHGKEKIQKNKPQFFFRLEIENESIKEHGFTDKLRADQRYSGTPLQQPPRFETSFRYTSAPSYFKKIKSKKVFRFKSQNEPIIEQGLNDRP